MSASPAPACPLTIIAWRLSSLTVTDLWWRYIALGGNQPRSATASYLAGGTTWPVPDHNALAQALNEALWELDHASLAPYRELPDRRPRRASHLEGSADSR